MVVDLSLFAVCAAAVPLLPDFDHMSSAAQPRSWLSRQRARVQHNRTRCTAHMAAASADACAVSAVDRRGVSFFPAPFAPYPSPADGGIGGEPRGDRALRADMRHTVKSKNISDRPVMDPKGPFQKGAFSRLKSFREKNVPAEHHFRACTSSKRSPPTPAQRARPSKSPGVLLYPSQVLKKRSCRTREVFLRRLCKSGPVSGYEARASDARQTAAPVRKAAPRLSAPYI